jgi:mono/diheme cytochrome c family protein
MQLAGPRRATELLRWLACAAASCGLAGVLHGLVTATQRAQAVAPAGAAAQAPRLPELLSETGLYVAGSTTEVDPRNLFYVPQYPLWSDGASKRRWVRLPEGAAIDARDADAWRFPAGTRFWKEFSFGRRVETRYIERLADGSFRYATYVWSDDGRDARLSRSASAAVVATQDGGSHEVPSESDCRACHEGRRSPILGFGALQLSPERDPNAPHREAVPRGSVDLAALTARGLLSGLPEQLLRVPPRIAAASPRGRAALGYLFGNCSGCHNAEGPLASLGLDFDQRVGVPEAPRALRSAVGRPSGFAIPGASHTLRIAPGRPDASALAFRMASRFPATQMPPLGTREVDDEALALVRGWITNDLAEVPNTTGERP